MEEKLKFAVLGTGFWSDFQIKGWQEIEGVELVALCDPEGDKAEESAKRHGINRFYQDASALLENETLDFVDIISSIPSHAQLVRLAAKKGVHVICQKPMAEDFQTCKELVEVCQKAGVQFFIHENARFQLPIRACKDLIQNGEIGQPFKARLTFCSGFPVFENQPSLANLDQFIISDLGVHLLDTARFLFGEVEQIYCQTQKVNPKIKGEDVANILMRMQNGIDCFVEMSYASYLEKESFPQTLMLIEGDTGSMRLDHNHLLTLTQKGKGSSSWKVDPPVYAWADPDYALIHSSIVACNLNILSGLQGKGIGETSGADNLKTMELVFLSYDSAQHNQVMKPKHG